MIKKISFAILMTTVLYATSCPDEEKMQEDRAAPIIGLLIRLGWTYSSYLNAPSLNDPLYSGGPSKPGKCLSCHNQP